MDLIYFLKVLSRRKWLILLVTICATGLTYFLSSRSPKLYLASAQIATGFTDRAEDKNENTPTAINAKFSNFVELINSPNCASMVSYRLMLNDLNSPQPYRNMQEINKSYMVDEISHAKLLYQQKLDSLEILFPDTESEETPIRILKAAAYDDKYLLKKLEVKRIPNTDFVEIKFTSENPHLSAFVVNTYCQEIIRYYNFVKMNKIEKSLQYYTGLVIQKKNELENKIDSLDNYKSSNEVTNYGLEAQAKLDQIAKLEFSRDEENKKIQAMKQALRTISGQLSEESSAGQETKNTNNRIYELRKKIADVNNRYVSGGMTNTRLGDSLRTLRAELESQIARSGTGGSNEQDLMQKKTNLEIDIQMATSNVASLNNSIASLRTNLTGFASKEAAIGALELAVNVAKEEYLLVLDKYNALKNLSLNSGNLHQIELGMPPDFPVPSNTMMMTLLAGIVSLVFCIVVLFVLEYIDVSIKTAGNFTKTTGLPLLGFLNELKTTKMDYESVFSNTSNPVRVETFKEQLRKIRHEAETTNAKVLLCTSTKKGEGKSFLILSLAYAFSISNKRVLMVDSNFKDNALTRMFGEKTEGKTLLGSEPTRTHSFDFDKLIVNTGRKNIDFIGCEKTALSPSEIFEAGKLKELISFLSHKYDYILIESAELNQYADTKELAPYADKVLAVFAADSQIRQIDQLSLEYLKGLNGKYGGSILNKVRMDNLSL